MTLKNFTISQIWNFGIINLKIQNYKFGVFKFVISEIANMGLFLYECPYCKKVYKTVDSIKTHLRKYHGTSRIDNVKRISTRTYEYVETKIDEID
jgi:uncharacterized C2H2 Zn-finger protein